MLHYTSGGQYKVPMVIRGPGGVGRQLGAEHSQRLESYFQSIPGVQLVSMTNREPPSSLNGNLWGEFWGYFKRFFTTRKSAYQRHGKKSRIGTKN